LTAAELLHAVCGLFASTKGAKSSERANSHHGTGQNSQDSPEYGSRAQRRNIELFQLMVTTARQMFPRAARDPLFGVAPGVHHQEGMTLRTAALFRHSERVKGMPSVNIRLPVRRWVDRKLILRLVFSGCNVELGNDPSDDTHIITLHGYAEPAVCVSQN
jgi:hypothetical protein